MAKFKGTAQGQQTPCALNESSSTMNVEAKKSELLYKELKELEEHVFKSRLVTEEEAVGKTVKSTIFKYGEWQKEDILIILFEDNTSLLFLNSQVSYKESVWNAHYNSSTQESFAYPTDVMRDILDIEDEHGSPMLVDMDVFNQIMEKAKEWALARHQETVKEQIQKKLDEISKLKDQL